LIGVKNTTNEPQDNGFRHAAVLVFAYASESEMVKVVIAFSFLALALFIGSVSPQAASTGDKHLKGKVDWSVFLPPGEGRVEVINACSGCHGLTQVITQNKSRSGWNTSVHNMITLNQAPVVSEDIPVIVEYLSKNIGRNNPIQELPMSINRSSGKALERLPGMSVDLVQAIIEYRNNVGLFASINDLLKVKGMSAAKLTRIKPYINVN
jgi:competence protein ComEA